MKPTPFILAALAAAIFLFTGCANQALYYNQNYPSTTQQHNFNMDSAECRAYAAQASPVPQVHLNSQANTRTSGTFDVYGSGGQSAYGTYTQNTYHDNTAAQWADISNTFSAIGAQARQDNLYWACMSRKGWFRVTQEQANTLVRQDPGGQRAPSATINKKPKPVPKKTSMVIAGIPSSMPRYTMPKDATLPLKNPKDPNMVLWIDPEKWELSSADDNGFNFVLKKHGVLGNAVYYDHNLETKNPAQWAVNTWKEYFDLHQGGAQVLDDEYRVVNGLPVRYVAMKIRMKNTDMITIGYFHADAHKICQVSTGVYAGQFPAKKNEMIDFLNGLVVVK